ncbi:MAG: hypothetical protein R3A44_14035 [Caldilineaceae bacterium]
MTNMILPIDAAVSTAAVESRLHVAVHIQADVLEPETARRCANRWLLLQVGNLLRAEQPELVLGQQLLWRFNVLLAVPDLLQQGRGQVNPIGHLHLDAVTGEAVVSEDFIQSLLDNANALVVH